MTRHSNITGEGGIRKIPPEDGDLGDDEPRFTLLSYSDLRKLPSPEWLVHKVLPSGGFCFLYGAPGVGKTFVALSIGCSVAIGTNWLGRATKVGSVLYIAAEGVHGLRRRVLAATYRDREDTEPILEKRMYFLGEGVQLADGESRDLLDAISELPSPPALIVVDTLARCSQGQDENSAKDMGLFVAGCYELRRATGATILVIHHTTKDGGWERGSSVLRGAADTMIELSGGGERMAFRCDKQKEAAPFEDIALELVPVDLGETATGEPVGSCRVGLIESETSGAESHLGLRPASLTICRTLRDHFFEDGATSTNLRVVCKIPKSTFQRHIRSLTDTGYVDRYPVGGSHKFRLTDKFRDPEVSQVSGSLSESRHPVGPGLTPPPPLEGGGGGTGPEPATEAQEPTDDLQGRPPGPAEAEIEEREAAP